jgi:hypothetical protein
MGFACALLLNLLPVITWYFPDQCFYTYLGRSISTFSRKPDPESHTLWKRLLILSKNKSNVPMRIAVIAVKANKIKMQSKNHFLPIEGTTTFCSSGIANIA